MKNFMLGVFFGVFCVFSTAGCVCVVHRHHNNSVCVNPHCKCVHCNCNDCHCVHNNNCGFEEGCCVK